MREASCEAMCVVVEVWNILHSFACLFSYLPGALVCIKTSPWNVGDSQLLIGDAAHAVVPFYGQVGEADWH